MSVIALTNAFAYVAGYDFTADINQVMVKTAVESKDKTTMRSGGYREKLGGLKSVEFNMGGFWQSATSQAVDPEMFPALGTLDQVFTVADVETAGQPAYIFQAGKFDYSPITGAVGDPAGFTASAVGTNSVGSIRCQLAKAKGTVAATGALGTALNLGAASSTQYLYSTFHVFGTPGTTITVIVESAPDNTFASPTTRISFTGITTAGGTWGTRVAGAITDTWYRMKVTAITGTFTVAGAIGVQ